MTQHFENPFTTRAMSTEQADQLRLTVATDPVSVRHFMRELESFYGGGPISGAAESLWGTAKQFELQRSQTKSLKQSPFYTGTLLGMHTVELMSQPKDIREYLWPGCISIIFSEQGPQAIRQRLGGLAANGAQLSAELQPDFVAWSQNYDHIHEDRSDFVLGAYMAIGFVEYAQLRDMSDRLLADFEDSGFYD